MNVQLIIQERDPSRTTTINLPPSVEVNKLLYNVACFWEGRVGKALDEAQSAAYNGDIDTLAAATKVARQNEDLREACQRAAEMYDIRLNANKREEVEESCES